MENRNLMNNITDRELKLCALAISLYETRIQAPASFPRIFCMVDDDIVNQVLQAIAEDPEDGIKELECLRLREEYNQICEQRMEQGKPPVKKKPNLTEDELNSLRLSAENGDPKAQNELGGVYRNGRGVPQDYSQASMWYRKAAEQGNADAQLNLAFSYEMGEGVPKDCSQAAFWFGKAAGQGDAMAQFLLGDMYKTGRGVPQDCGRAAFWYRKAADQDEVNAQLRLAAMYFHGQGIDRDYSRAAALYRKAVTKLYEICTANAEALSGTGGEACEEETDEA